MFALFYPRKSLFVCDISYILPEKEFICTRLPNILVPRGRSIRGTSWRKIRLQLRETGFQQQPLTHAVWGQELYHLSGLRRLQEWHFCQRELVMYVHERHVILFFPVDVPVNITHLSKSCFDIGPTSQTLVQYCTNFEILHQLWENVLYLVYGPADTRRSINVGSTLVHRLRRWTNVKPTLIQHLVSAGGGLWRSIHQR